MNDVLSFFLGILSGLITSILVSVLFKSFEAFRKIVPPKLRKSFDCEFKNQKSAEKSILKDAINSEFMCVFAMKGGSFCAPVANDDNLGLCEIFVDLNKYGHLEQKYLISDLNNPYVAVRERELSRDGSTLRNGIITSHQRLEEGMKLNRKIQFRKHKEIVRLRLIIFDNALYVSFQPKDQKGRMSPMQRYLKGSSGYTALKSYFDEMWEKYCDQEPSNDNSQSVPAEV